MEAIVRSSSEYRQLKQKYDSIQDRLSGFAGLLTEHAQNLKSKGISFELERDLNTLIKNENISVSAYNGVVNIGEIFGYASYGRDYK